MPKLSKRHTQTPTPGQSQHAVSDCAALLRADATRRDAQKQVAKRTIHKALLCSLSLSLALHRFCLRSACGSAWKWSSNTKAARRRPQRRRRRRRQRRRWPTQQNFMNGICKFSFHLQRCAVAAAADVVVVVQR